MQGGDGRRSELPRHAHEMSSLDEVRVSLQCGQAIAQYLDGLSRGSCAQGVFPAGELEPRTQGPVGDDCHIRNGASPKGSVSEDVGYLVAPKRPCASSEFLDLDAPRPIEGTICIDDFD